MSGHQRIFGGQWPLGLPLLILAVYAKGAALPIAALILITCLFKLYVERYRFRFSSASVLSLLISAALVFLYQRHFYPTVAAYNLLAVPSGSSSALVHFVAQAISSIAKGPLHYAGWLLFGSLPLLAWLMYLLRQTKGRSALPAFFLIVSSYGVFTAHPIKAQVLTIWLIPGLWALLLTSLAHIPLGFRAPAWTKYVGVLCCGWALFSPLVALRSLSTQDRNEALRLREQSALIAQSIRSQSSAPRALRILTNFRLTRPGNWVENCYDTYRVLLFEELQKKSPLLYGWELGTWSDEWQKEICGFHNEDYLFLLASTNSEQVHPRGRASYLWETVPRSTVARFSKSILPPFAGGPLHELNAWLVPHASEFCSSGQK